jgi:predicted thioesterase
MVTTPVPVQDLQISHAPVAAERNVVPAEQVGRKEDDEEGIGTFLNIRHKSPAMLGDTVEFIATVSVLEGHQIDCTFVAKVGDRIVAEGEQGQKILKKEKLERLVNQIING